MHTILRRSTYADPLEVELRVPGCCNVLDPCAACRARRDEVRAARRDALIHTLTHARARRAVRGRATAGLPTALPAALPTDLRVGADC